jgi:aminopeptidase 2
MSARPDSAVAGVHTEALFEGVNEGSWYATAFETTPPVSLEGSKEQDLLTTIQMSTYLLAYANGELVHLESSYKSPLSGRVRPLRIYGGLLT